MKRVNGLPRMASVQGAAVDEADIAALKRPPIRGYSLGAGSGVYASAHPGVVQLMVRADDSYTVIRLTPEEAQLFATFAGSASAKEFVLEALRGLREEIIGVHATLPIDDPNAAGYETVLDMIAERVSVLKLGGPEDSQ